MHRGYLKLWRKIRDNPHCHNPDFMALWVWLLLEAVHKPNDQLFGGKRITCQPGQFTTGREQLSKLTGISEWKIHRFLKCLENAQQITQQTSNTNRLISIVNWDRYQQQEHKNCTTNRTTTAQRPHTLKECKNVKKREGEETPTLEAVKLYSKEITSRADPVVFYDHYTANGWMIGKNRMKDWKATLRNWSRRETKPHHNVPKTNKLIGAEMYGKL